MGDLDSDPAGIPGVAPPEHEVQAALQVLIQHADAQVRGSTATVSAWFNAETVRAKGRSLRARERHAIAQQRLAAEAAQSTQLLERQNEWMRGIDERLQELLETPRPFSGEDPDTQVTQAPAQPWRGWAFIDSMTENPGRTLTVFGLFLLFLNALGLGLRDNDMDRLLEALEDQGVVPTLEDVNAPASDPDP